MKNTNKFKLIGLGVLTLVVGGVAYGQTVQVTAAGGSNYPIQLNCGGTTQLTGSAPSASVACTTTQLTASIASGNSCAIDLNTGISTPSGCGVLTSATNINLSPTSTFGPPSAPPSGGGVSGSYYVNISALNPTSAPLTITGCQGNSPLVVSADSAPLCNIPAGGITISNGTNQCQLGGASSTCTTAQPIGVPGTTVILSGWGSGSGGGGGGGGGAPARSITIINSTSTDPLTVYMGFVGNTYACYQQSDFNSFCTFTKDNQYICSFSVPKNQPQVINFNQSCQVSVAFTPQNIPWGPCPTSLAEFTFNGNIGGVTQDTVDVSLVNGINYNVLIAGSSTGTMVNTATAAPVYNNVPGIYPPGCDECALSVSPPTWPGCPGVVPQSQCQGGTQYNPNTACQISTPSNNNSYSVTFSGM